MEYNEFIQIKMPAFIEILFKNSRLELMSILCILSCFNKKSKGISIDELVFYYALVTSNSLLLNNESKKIGEVLYDTDIRYESLKQKAKHYLIILENHNRISLKNENGAIFIKNTSEGSALVKSLTSSYYYNIISMITKIKTDIKYNKSNVKKIEMGEWNYEYIY